MCVDLKGDCDCLWKDKFPGVAKQSERSQWIPFHQFQCLVGEQCWATGSSEAATAVPHAPLENATTQLILNNLAALLLLISHSPSTLSLSLRTSRHSGTLHSLRPNPRRRIIRFSQATNQSIGGTLTSDDAAACDRADMTPCRNNKKLPR